MSAPVPPLRIFIVEDHRDTLEALRMYVEQLGHSVAAATTMQSALSQLASVPCDLLLCDIGLPDGDGWELLRRLETTPPPFAVAMSGFGRNANVIQSRAVGFRHHLTKPFHPEEIDSVLDEASQELFARQQKTAPSCP